jgi:hypothetical protein
MLNTRHDLSAIPDAIEAPAGRSRLLTRLSRDIGVAAVASELGLKPQECEPELATAIARGARYLAPVKMEALAS